MCPAKFTRQAITEEQKQTLSMLTPIAKTKPGVIVPRTKLPEELRVEIICAEPSSYSRQGSVGW
jgi:hypothetical protein